MSASGRPRGEWSGGPLVVPFAGELCYTLAHTAEYLVVWFLALPARYYAPTTQQISALVRPVLLRYLPVPLRISPYLPASPRSSSHLPASPRISPYLSAYVPISHIPPYPAADTAKNSGHTRMLRQ